MLGKDQNDFYKFEILIDGNVPVFDARKEVEFDNYIHTYRYDRLGIMSGYYSSVFNVGGEKFKVNVVEVLEFDEVQGCMSVGSSKMAVSEQRGSYDGSKEILNFALKTEMQDESMHLFIFLFYDLFFRGSSRLFLSRPSPLSFDRTVEGGGYPNLCVNPCAMI